MTKNTIRRRTFLTAMAALPTFAILTRRGEAAQFRWKLATGQEPSHPVNMRAAQAIAKIKEATEGGLDITPYPAAQPGTDKQLIAQTRLAVSGFMSICRIGFWSSGMAQIGESISSVSAQNAFVFIGASGENVIV